MAVENTQTRAVTGWLAAVREDGVEFGLLGPLLVRAGDRPVQIPAGKQRVLLAALLDASHVVATGMLAEALWQDDPPGSKPWTSSTSCTTPTAARSAPSSPAQTTVHPSST
jgi:hypothetical protein